MKKPADRLAGDAVFGERQVIVRQLLQRHAAFPVLSKRMVFGKKHKPILHFEVHILDEWQMANPAK